MSKKQQKTSGGAGDGPESHSVYDFLYNDSRRIGSYLSQFGVGHLQQLTQTKEAERGTQKGAETEGKLGVPGVAGGTHKAIQQTTLAAAEGSVRVYDPLWTNARAFLDHLNENEMIQRELGAAAIGQFVLVTGYLNILDLVMMKSAWQLASVSRAIKQGMVPASGHKAITAAQKAEERQQKENAELVVELMQIMPHQINCSLITREGPAHMLWCALREEYMAITASEIVMTHGGTMPGDWAILGVLNAQPDFVAVSSLGQPVNEEADIGIMDSIVGRVSAMLAPMVRIGLGRPASAYAVTPLLIFREVT